MNAGDLKHKVTIQRPPATDDLQGGLTGAWTDVTGAVNIWASITPTGSYRKYDTAQVLLNVTHEVKIRHVAGIDSNMRVVWGTRTLLIRSVMNTDESGVELVLLCQEEAA